jgi:hypothetical protein
MPLYEFILRVSGRPDEVRISDRNSLREGDELEIAGRRWIVAAKQPANGDRSDRLSVEERLILVRRSDAAPRART